MITFEEAKAHIAQLPLHLTTEKMKIWEASGRILATEICAAQDLPAWSNSAMDGYAMRHEDIVGASPTNPVLLPITETIQAGDRTEYTLQPGTCARIFTGAPTPKNTDVVIMQENTTVHGDSIRIEQCPSLWNNIRRQGEEATLGTPILKAGTTLDAASIGLALSASVHEVEVWSLPKIGILSTGDELNDPRKGGTLKMGQIWATNTINLQMALHELGIQAIDCGIAKDTLESTRQAFLHALEQVNVDILITTGGVSVGDFDVVHKALEDLPGFDVSMNFWKIRMKPGKPVAIGIIRTPHKNVPLFALPGNPVSALMGFYQFVRPFVLGKMQVAQPELPTLKVTLGEDFSKRGSRLEFVRVWLKDVNGELQAFSTGNQSSAQMSSFADATALLPFPADEHRLHKGQPHTVQRLPISSKWPATWRTDT